MAIFATHVNFLLSVPHVKISQDRELLKFKHRNHVVNSFHRCCVHLLVNLEAKPTAADKNIRGRSSLLTHLIVGDPRFIVVVVHNQKRFSIGSEDFCGVRKVVDILT
jgi:hypothetical protein